MIAIAADPAFGGSHAGAGVVDLAARIRQGEGMLGLRSWAASATIVALGSFAVVACSGDPAPTTGVWEVSTDEQVGQSTTSFAAAVSNVECTSGRVPVVEDVDVSTSESEVVVTVMVRGHHGYQDCQGTPPAPYTIDLGEPLGQRVLVDGGCGEGQRAHGTALCPEGAIRYEPQPSR